MNSVGIQLEAFDYEILKNILQKYPYRFYVYGSRARGDARKYSDIDIYCNETIEEIDLVNLQIDLEESNITIKVDITDKSRCSDEFFNMIKCDLVEIK